jgi:prolyl-tRNA synthetase
VTRKFRDESRPKHTLLRAREFLMKDMYSFHLSEECARQTYAEVGGAYGRLFDRLDLATVRAEASVGAMGGSRSHEFLVESEVGEDRVHVCGACGGAVSGDLEAEGAGVCACGEGADRQVKRCIEVGHTFLLGEWMRQGQ